MALKHAFTNPKSDGGDATVVRPSDWNADHVVDKNGITMTAGTPDPSAPSADNLVIWTKNRGGRQLLNMVGPSGIDTSLQPALFGNSIVQWLPTTGTTLYVGGGCTYTAHNSGTGAAQSHPVLANTNAMTRMKRANFGTGTTIMGASGIQSSRALVLRGNATGVGGFFFATRFGIETLASDQRAFVGLSENNVVMTADANTWDNTIGIEKGTADSVWYIVERSTSATRTSTGCTVTAGQILDMYMFCKPNDTKVTIRVLSPTTGTVYVDNVNFNTTLPSNTTFLYMQAHNQSQSGTTAKTLALNKMYLESDI